MKRYEFFTDRILMMRRIDELGKDDKYSNVGWMPLEIRTGYGEVIDRYPEFMGVIRYSVDVELTGYGDVGVTKMVVDLDLLCPKLGEKEMAELKGKRLAVTVKV